MRLKIQTLPIQTHPQYLELLNCRAVDGDTIEAHVKLPLGILCKRRIRLKGFLAPEHHGSSPTRAEAARQRLQDALDTHTIHIQCHGMRDDRYGRLTANLLLNGRAIHAGMVLGELQLTLEEHKADLAFAKRGGSVAQQL